MKNNLITTTALALVISTGVNAQSINPDEVGMAMRPHPPMIIAQTGPTALELDHGPSDSTVDTMIGMSIGTATVATLASWALPAAVAHSSGTMILISGGGYVAGTIGTAAVFTAALPLIAAGAIGTGVAYVSYKYKDDIAETMSDFSDRLNELEIF